MEMGVLTFGTQELVFTAIKESAVVGYGLGGGAKTQDTIGCRSYYNVT
jgi:hypothetical protein